VQVTFDCADPRAVAEFWKAVLGYVDPPSPEGFDSWDAYEATLPPEKQGADWACQDAGGVGPRLFFQRVPETKTVKNRLHLDVNVSGGRAVPLAERVQRVDGEAKRLADLGATISGPMSAEGEDWYAVGMKDPEGNEFDIN
jgi:hypothetical protein